MLVDEPPPVAAAFTDSDRVALASRLKAQGYGLGFDLVGITALGPAVMVTRTTARRGSRPCRRRIGSSLDGEPR